MAEIDNKLLEKYGGAVPRYTSYPTAPHFRHDVPNSYVAWLLSSQPADRPVSLYFHIPFCSQLCHYCGCLTKVINHDQPMQDYLQLLRQEIRIVGEAIGHRARVGHIHFGGGTPNILAPADLQSLFEMVGRYFDVPADVDIAMEIDPRLLTEEKVKGYAALGLSRASLGVQDFQPDVQKAINRIQPFESVARCVGWLRDAGVKSVNFDLIYGLPLQTLEGIVDNVEKAVSLQPDRFALFGYAHVPWMRPHQKLLEKYELPGIMARYEQQDMAARNLCGSGYQAIGMDHFALPADPLATASEARTLKRNFQGYTTDQAETIIGFGMSSISSFPAAYVQNTTDISAYRSQLREGTLPIARGCLLEAEDRLRRELIETLMCYFEVNLKQVCEKYGMVPDVLSESVDALDELVGDGLVAVDGDRITVTPKGRPFVRVACAQFDAYLNHNQEAARHAKAV